MHRLKRTFECLAVILLCLVAVSGYYKTTDKTDIIEPPLLTEQSRTSPRPELPTAAEQTTPAPPEHPAITSEPEPEPVIEVDEPPLYQIPLSDELQMYLYEVCEEGGVPFEFVLALMGNESSYQADVISKTNDYGLMQVNHCNHKWLAEEIGVVDFLDPEENIRAGIYILSGLFEKYEDPHKVLMAYNMGESGARNLWEQGVYESNYSRRVMSRIDELQRKEGNP